MNEVTPDEERRRRSAAAGAALRQWLIERDLARETDGSLTPKPPGEFTPIETRGQPLSEMILEERGPR